MAGRADPGLAGAALEDKAWALCFADFNSWYDRKRDILERMRRFHQGAGRRSIVAPSLEQFLPQVRGHDGRVAKFINPLSRAATKAKLSSNQKCRGLRRAGRHLPPDSNDRPS